MGSISVRKYIKWNNFRPSEPTSTLVLTSPEGRFVDLRILLLARSASNLTLTEQTNEEAMKPLPVAEVAAAVAQQVAAAVAAGDGQVQIPLSRLYLGFSGRSQSWTRMCGNERAKHSWWKHWMDLTSQDHDQTPDEADLFPQPDGTTLEKGYMYNPDLHRSMLYDELWEDPEPVTGILGRDGRRVDDGAAATARCVVLKLDDVAFESRGHVILLGQFCQGIIKVGQDVSAQRWEWKEGRGWEMTHQIGLIEIPCDQVITQAEAPLKVGHEIRDAREMVWVVEESVP